MSELVIKDLHVKVDGKSILNGVNLTVKQGEVHALMGPNGSGKSTLAYALMGHPKYKIERGSVSIDGEEITKLPPEERSRLGMFLSFQQPYEVSGVTLTKFLYEAFMKKNVNGKSPGEKAKEFKQLLKQNMEALSMSEEYAKRFVNLGFSGGEKKRSEMLQMTMLKPKFAILDEPDSGLDVDALKTISNVINSMHGPQVGILIITHYKRILEHVNADTVHIMLNGEIVESGGMEIARQLETKGYAKFRSEGPI